VRVRFGRQHLEAGGIVGEVQPGAGADLHHDAIGVGEQASTPGGEPGPVAERTEAAVAEGVDRVALRHRRSRGRVLAVHVTTRVRPAAT
jgi:hypothetical protein